MAVLTEKKIEILAKQKNSGYGDFPFVYHSKYIFITTFYAKYVQNAAWKRFRDGWSKSDAAVVLARLYVRTRSISLALGRAQVGEKAKKLIFILFDLFLLLLPVSAIDALFPVNKKGNESSGSADQGGVAGGSIYFRFGEEENAVRPDAHSTKLPSLIYHTYI